MLHSILSVVVPVLSAAMLGSALAFREPDTANRVDRLAHIVRHCKIVGVRSKKGRVYPLALLRANAHKYHRAPVNIDHVEPGARRPLAHRNGHVENITVEPDGLYADWHYNPEHPLTPQILSDADHAPWRLGFSHDTRGSSHNEHGTVYVDSIDKVCSVDLVANPAGCDGLFEDTVNPYTMSFETLTERYEEERLEAAGIPPADASLFQRLRRFVRQ